MLPPPKSDAVINCPATAISPDRSTATHPGYTLPVPKAFAQSVAPDALSLTNTRLLEPGAESMMPPPKLTLADCRIPATTTLSLASTATPTPHSVDGPPNRSAHSKLPEGEYFATNISLAPTFKLLSDINETPPKSTV